MSKKPKLDNDATNVNQIGEGSSGSLPIKIEQDQALFHQQQQQELDELRKFQCERLSFVLKEQSKKDLLMINTKMEGRASLTLAQKNQEFADLIREKMEIDDRLKILDIENKRLKRILQENVRKRANDTVVVDDEATSSCAGVSLPETKERKCSNCGSFGDTIVLILPCRHLSCCPKCEAGIVACPICKSSRKNSIEVFV